LVGHGAAASVTVATGAGGAMHLPFVVEQPPVQQSEDWLQDAPSAAHAPVHIRLLHVPLQQSAVVTHGAPRGRQGPGPTSQRSSFVHA
jgi:hypothetical protein